MSGRRAGPTRATPDMVAQLAAEGHGRNSCARELGLSRRQVDRLAREAGIKWERAATEAATRARMIDRRAELAEDFSEISDKAAERLLDALDADDLDPRVLQALAQVAGAATDKLTALADRLTADDGTGDSVLDKLAAGFQSWAAHVEQLDHIQHDTTTNNEEHSNG